MVPFGVVWIMHAYFYAQPERASVPPQAIKVARKHR